MKKIFLLGSLLLGLLTMVSLPVSAQGISIHSRQAAEEAEEPPVDESEKLVWDQEGIRLTLRENGSTGYGWEIRGLEEQEVIRCASSDSVYTGRHGIVGAPSMHTWVFVPEKPGDVKLVFRYNRSFEKNSTCRTIKLRVHVGENMRYTVAMEED